MFPKRFDPSFQHWKSVRKSYLSILEIGGSHAHKLKPLIEALGVITLIITDLDPVDPRENRSAVLPEKEKGYMENTKYLENGEFVKQTRTDL